MKRAVRSTILRYAGAVASVVLATGVRALLEPWLGDQFAFLTYYPAVVLTALAGGFGPTLLTTALSAVWVAYAYLSPIESVAIEGHPDHVAMAVFAVSGVLAALLSGRERRLRVEVSAQRQQLAAEREQLRITLQSIGDGVIATDAHGTVTLLNPVAQLLTGWGDQAVGRPLTEIFAITNEVTGQPAENPVDRVLREGVVVGLANHTILTARDGTAWPIDDSAAPIRDGSGHVRGCVLVFHDVTEKRGAESKLRASEEQLRRIFDQSTAGIAQVDLRGRFVLVNQHFCAITGYSAAELRERTDAAITHPDDQTHDRGLCERAVADRQPYTVEKRFVRPDGAAVWVRNNVSVVTDADGRPTALLAVAVDITDRKRAERELFVSRERLDFVVHSSGVGLWYCDLPFDKLVWNAQVKEHFGLPADAAVTIETFFDRLHPDDRARTRTAIEQSIRDRTGYDIEYRTVGLDGRERWIRAIGRAAYDAAGAPIHFDGVTVDTTERKRLEEELRASERRFRAAFNQQFQFMVILTPDGTVLEANDVSFQATGVPRARVVGRPFWDAPWWHSLPATQAQWRAQIAEALRSRGPVPGEVEYINADGEKRHGTTFVTALKDESGVVTGLIAEGRDDTERVRAEASLRRQVERLRLLNESAAHLLHADNPDAMVRGLFERVKDHVGADTYFNFMVNEAGDALRLESCAGIPPAEAQRIRRLEFGQAICGNVAARRQAIVAADIQHSDDPKVQLVKGYGIQTYACNPLLTDGKLLGTLSFASRTRGHFDDDELEFLRTLCHYVTVAYERLRLVNELREADRRKDDFLAMLAHELRNPLAPIRNALQILRMPNVDGGTAERAREMMERQLQHLVRLVDDLLDVSRIMRDKIELRSETVDLRQVVERAREMVETVAEAQGQELTVTTPAEPVNVRGDSVRLAQVLANLLNNAVKFSERAGPIRLGLEREDGAAVLRVRDAGVGIAPELMPRIFDLFVQGDRGSARTQGGLGIGLTLVRRLVEMHGGRVAAQSDGPGQGSEFVVRLPLLAAAAPASVQPPAEPDAPSRQRVVVVDDNVDAAESLAMVLRLMGHEVRTAHDGPAGLTAVREFRPAVVLLDLGLPGMDGYEVARRLRQSPDGQALRVIAVSGYGQDEDRRRTQAAGFDRHLTKPVEPTALESLFAP